MTRTPCCETRPANWLGSESKSGAPPGWPDRVCRDQRRAESACGAATGAGYFWPAWILLGWGVGMVFAEWDYFCKPATVTEADVDKELRRLR